MNDPALAFDDQPVLNGPDLMLRPMVAADHDALFAAAANPRIWAGHPASDRYRPEVFGPYFAALLEGGGTLVVIERKGGRMMGCSRYYTVAERPGAIAIGYTFLNDAWWGGHANFEMKRLMIDHAFARFPEVWFDIAPDNIRSQKATGKLGAEFAGEAVLTLGGKPTAMKCYRLTPSAWARTCAERN